MDRYIQKYLSAINNAKTPKELSIIIDRIYSDGFEDGSNNA
jgi:hypothetical protein